MLVNSMVHCKSLACFYCSFLLHFRDLNSAHMPFLILPIATHLYHISPGYKAANVPLARRDAREAVDVSSPSSSGPNSSVYGYVLPVLLVAVAVLALMISAAMCVKGEHNEER